MIYHLQVQDLRDWGSRIATVGGLPQGVQGQSGLQSIPLCVNAMFYLFICLDVCIFAPFDLLYGFPYINQGSQDSSSGKNCLPAQMILTRGKSTLKSTTMTFIPGW